MNIDQMLKNIEEYAIHFSQHEQRVYETQSLIKLRPEEVKDELGKMEAQLTEESQIIISNLNEFSADKLFELIAMLSIKVRLLQENMYDKALNYGGTKASLEIAKRNNDGRELYSNPSVWAREVVNQEDEMKALKNKTQVYSAFIGTVSHLVQRKIATNVIEEYVENSNYPYVDETSMNHPTNRHI